MARLRTPWWMYLFAASFLATFSMIVYNDLFGPEQAGISAEYRSGAMVVTEVQPGSSGEQWDIWALSIIAYELLTGVYR
jgi:hypothetical protein